jgi:hypothetical protein
MKKVSLILILSFLYFSNLASAQQVVFTVLGTKGYVKIGDQKLKVGSKLKAGESVEIGESAYLGLLTTDHRTMEITQKGVYTVQQLLAKVSAKQKLPDAYAKFVIDELTKVDVEGISAKNRFQHMNKSGAVKRGGLAINYIDFFKTGEGGHQLYGNTLVLMWYVPEVEGKPKLPIESYLLGIVGMDSTSYFKKNVKENEISISLSSIKNEGSTTLVCKVAPLDKNGISLDKTDIDGVMINLLEGAEKSKITAELKQFAGGTALDQLMMARFFEEKHLYIDAMAAYKEAIRLSDGSEEYENLYYQFLLRYIKM